jgi:spermidine/putrescine transport system permease protein
VPGRAVDRLRNALLVVPGIAWLVLFFVVPLTFIVVVSLGRRDELHRIVLDPLTLENYQDVFNPIFLPTIVQSLYLATATTVVSLAIGFPIAYWISRYGGRRKTLLLVLVMLPFWTSWLIRTYSWMIVLRDNGIVNQALQAVGLTQEPLILLYTDFSVILGMVYGFLPFAILPLFVSIDRLDPNLIAAGRDLYANGRQAFRHVTLPLVRPGLIAAGLLTFIPAMGDFVNAELLGNTQTRMIGNVIQSRFLENNDYPTAAALSFILMAAILLMVAIYARVLGTDELTSAR